MVFICRPCTVLERLDELLVGEIKGPSNTTNKSLFNIIVV